MSGVHRRTVIKGAAAAAAAAPFSWSPSRTAAAAAGSGQATELHWLEGSAPAVHAGATRDVPWARGAYRPERRFRPTTADGEEVPVRSWVTAYSPDAAQWALAAIQNLAPIGDRIPS
ncbi:RIFT barrel domain-containing protein [Streptomyces aurantiogriseus]|uniref:PcRGLX/YetA-like N-terminal RIFT barrel domain-containing protein n=1 Tax=Streptomyces aurantiogriseus TaxID=66870 RepID=A0A918F173_9ACTN|nr:hypothetical protein [Streptomyces aurantiogriseus]GGQ98630.1 hypothetical protein GCM10010251_12340 [Streptomyces aurantiogriseus]